MKNVIVIGGNGFQGKPIVDYLVTKGINTYTLTRRPHKITSQGTSVEGDLADLHSLKRAFRNMDGIIYVLPLSNYDNMVNYTKNVVKAAVANDVQKIVMNTSVSGVDTYVDNYSLNLKFEAESILKESGFNYVIVRPTIYLDNFLAPHYLESIFNEGTIGYITPGDFNISWISLDDNAHFTIAALLKEEVFNTTYEVGGIEALSGDDLAELLGQRLGRKVVYRQIPKEIMESVLNEMLGNPVGTRVVEFYDWAIDTRGNLVYDSEKAVKELDVQPKKVTEWLATQTVWGSDFETSTALH